MGPLDVRRGAQQVEVVLSPQQRTGHESRRLQKTLEKDVADSERLQTAGYLKILLFQLACRLQSLGIGRLSENTPVSASRISGRLLRNYSRRDGGRSQASSPGAWKPKGESTRSGPRTRELDAIGRRRAFGGAPPRSDGTRGRAERPPRPPEVQRADAIEQETLPHFTTPAREKPGSGKLWLDGSVMGSARKTRRRPAAVDGAGIGVVSCVV